MLLLIGAAEHGNVSDRISEEAICPNRRGLTDRAD
jgi:hypothetical protein